MVHVAAVIFQLKLSVNNKNLSYADLKHFTTFAVDIYMCVCFLLLCKHLKSRGNDRFIVLFTTQIHFSLRWVYGSDVKLVPI